MIHYPHLSDITLNHTGSSVPHSSDIVGRNSVVHHLIYCPLIQSVIIDCYLEVDAMKVSVLMTSVVPDLVLFPPRRVAVCHELEVWRGEQLVYSFIHLYLHIVKCY